MLQILSKQLLTDPSRFRSYTEGSVGAPKGKQSRYIVLGKINAKRTVFHNRLMVQTTATSFPRPANVNAFIFFDLFIHNISWSLDNCDTCFVGTVDVK